MVAGVSVLGGCNDTPVEGTDEIGTGEETATETETGSDDATEDATEDTDTTEDTTEDAETTSGNTETWCVDGDLDGFGDPLDCTEVPEGEPPPNSVPEAMATDCNDDDANTFPGAAPNDDPDACMADADMDDWGDHMPMWPDVEPGTDCDDASANTYPGAAEIEGPDACMQDEDDDGYGEQMPVVPYVDEGSDCNDADVNIFMCALWCLDMDSDGQGDQDVCVGVPPGELPPEFYVENDDDCDDNAAVVYLGAAEQEPSLCTADVDDDGWGDIDTTQTYPDAHNGSDCDDSDAEKVVCVEVDPSCVDTDLGMGTELTAMAWGGTGNYTYSWVDAATLSDPDIANPIATPTAITTYSVTVTDGFGNMGTDDITVHINDEPWLLGGPMAECMAYGFLGVATPHAFADMDTTTCTTGNADPTAYVCDTVHENAKITGTMVVNPPVDDDDYIGFVWGWQNPDQYYLLHWKQALENIGGCNSAAGITVKRVDRIQPYAAGDFTCNVDTPNATVLLTPAETTTQGWVHGVQYGVELLYANDQTEITITNLGNMAVVANFVVMDTTYPSGQFGTYDYSQIRACNGPWTSNCL